MKRIALDSNILVYLAGVANADEDEPKIATAQVTVRALGESAVIVVPVQALGELFVVLRRSGVPADEARRTVLEYTENLSIPATSQATMTDALDLVLDHRMQLWDALILSAAADAGCTMLLSEDMQDGFVARGVTVVNPLAEKLHPKLAALLARE